MKENGISICGYAWGNNFCNNKSCQDYGLDINTCRNYLP